MESIVIKLIEQLPNLAIAIIIIWWFMQRFQEMLADMKQTTERLYALIEKLMEQIDNSPDQ